MTKRRLPPVPSVDPKRWKTDIIVETDIVGLFGALSGHPNLLLKYAASFVSKKAYATINATIKLQSIFRMRRDYRRFKIAKQYARETGRPFKLAHWMDVYWA